jgi:hypothetical protein
MYKLTNMKFSGKKYKGELNVTITDIFGNKSHICIKGSLGMTIEEYYQVVSRQHPDSFVNMYWDNGKNFICGQARNMKKDEILIDRGSMMMNTYLLKWYPEIHGATTF